MSAENDVDSARRSKDAMAVSWSSGAPEKPSAGSRSRERAITTLTSWRSPPVIARCERTLARASTGAPSANTASSSRSTAPPLVGRSRGCLASMRATRSSTSGGEAGASDDSFGVGSSRILARSAGMLSPTNAGRPARHSKSTHPSAKTSARASTSRCPRACSGAM